ncbi:unnamed protein product [Lymnaea stagnalis]|uniref:Tripartite motif-containing protein 3 n=1 Tax=Lymnaea stagnalis TaxID=6523 RepID=A0AAV2HXP7_LYMST
MFSISARDSLTLNNINTNSNANTINNQQQRKHHRQSTATKTPSTINSNENTINTTSNTINTTSNTMSENQKLQEDFLTCSICLEIFQEPKTLSCLHRFCEQCLQDHIQNQTEPTRKGFKCPVCRQFIMSPNPKAPPSEWASLLKTDFFLKELMKCNAIKPGAASTSTSRRETTLRHPCDVHAGNERDLYCTECNTAICHLCSGISHRGCGQVMTIEEAAQGRRAATEILIANLLESCNRSSSLKEFNRKAMDDFSKRKSAVEQAIRKRVNHLDKMLKQEERRLLENLDHDFKHEKNRIATRSRQYDLKIEQLINNIDSFVSRVGASSDFEILTDPTLLGAMNDNEDVIRGYESFVSRLSNIHIGFEATSISSLSVGEVEITLYHETSEIPPACMNLPTNKSDQTPPSATHLKNTESSDLRGNATIMALNSPKTLPAKSRPASRSDASEDQIWNLTGHHTSRDDTDMTHRSTTSAAASCVQDACPETDAVTSSARQPSATTRASASVIFKLRINDTLFEDDQTMPKLRGVIVTYPDNIIIATDWANQKIKAFHLIKEKDHGLLLPGKPWAVTQVRENLIAVSLPLSQKIGFYKTTPKLMALTTFATSRKYTGLAALDRSVLVASGGSNSPSVDLINLRGKVIKRFVLVSDGFPLLAYPAYLCVAPSAMIVVSDRELGFVTGFSLDGVIKFRFSLYGSQNLQEPNGVACDSSGRILVSDSRGLIRLSPEGQFEKILVGPQDDTLTQPWGVAVNDCGLMYVTSSDHELVVLVNN